jgi:hypothetical protein
MAQGGYEMLKNRMAQAQSQRNNRQSFQEPPYFRMPKDMVQQTVVEGEESRLFMPSDMVAFNKLPGFAVIRFIDDIKTFEWVWAHPLQKLITPRGKPSFTITLNEVCLDQNGENRDDCPGCKTEIVRKQRFWVNIIWRDAPVYELNDFGRPASPRRIIGVEDQIVVWNSGTSLFNILDEIQIEYGDVKIQDFKLKRDVNNDFTPYTVASRQPDAVELSAADRKLIEGRYDLRQLSKPNSYNEMAMLLGAAPRQEDAEEEAARSFAGGNPYESAGEQVNSPLARPRN